METRFFRAPAEFRAWLVEHHATATEVRVVLHLKASGKGGMTWSEAVDQALCFGWIDSIARRMDDAARVQRFTPRKPKSNWSAVNINKVAELTAQGLMMPAGVAALARREEARSGVYSYENRTWRRSTRSAKRCSGPILTRGSSSAGSRRPTGRRRSTG
jgi:uncharacterized protein YdeI (YjbR/CyaY-like superfamily)